MSDSDTHFLPYTPDRNAIELRLGADLAHLPIIRSVAGNIATRADFDLDTIADLRLAVDEACSALIEASSGDSLLVCRFNVYGSGLRFAGAVSTTGDSPPSSGSFGWQVLTSLTDSANSWIEEADGSQPRWLHLELTKMALVGSG